MPASKSNFPIFVTPRMDPKPMRRDPAPPRPEPRPVPSYQQVRAAFAERHPEHAAHFYPPAPITAARLETARKACFKPDGKIREGYGQRLKLLKALMAVHLLTPTPPAA